MKTMVDIAKIKEMLPHGAITEIAKNAGVSLQTVHYVLNGKSKNLKVLTEVANYLTEFKENQDNTINKLTLLIEQ